MELNEIIALVVAVGIVGLLVVYEIHMYRHMRSKINTAKEREQYWATQYLMVSNERDLLYYRVQSRDCQKVIAFESELKLAREEIKRLTELNDTYKQQLERNKKRKAAPGGANAESCK